MGVLSFSKAQIQMMELIMVAVVFMVVLLVALGFFFAFQQKGLEKSGEKACFVSNTVLLSAIASLPEVQCSIDGSREQCVDTVKLLVSGERGFSLPFSSHCQQRVFFTRLYPPLEGEFGEALCTTENYPDCGVFVLSEPAGSFSSAVRLTTPVSLYYPLDGSFVIGKLTVEVLL